jgi:hypothetical protein
MQFEKRIWNQFDGSVSISELLISIRGVTFMIILVLLLSTFLIPLKASDTAYKEFVKRLPGDGSSYFGNGFGSSVAVYGDLMVVGAPNATLDESNNRPGAAYLFSRNQGGRENWGWTRTVTDPDGANGDDFGAAVAVNGAVMVIGAPEDDDVGENSGSVFVYENIDGVWTQVQKLTASDPFDNLAFGNSVAVDGKVLVVGAPDLNTGEEGTTSGFAYIFEHDGDRWIEVQKIQKNNPNPDEEFGYRVAISGNTIAVSAPQDDVNDFLVGAVYIFEYEDGSWVQKQQLVPSDADQSFSPQVGLSLDMDGETLIAGSPWSDNCDGNGCGSIYVFEKGDEGWEETQILRGSNSNDLRFGWDVSIDGSIIVGSELRNSEQAFIAGAAYVYKRENGVWNESQLLVASDGEAGDAFGTAVAVDGETIVGASPRRDEPTSEEGVVYVFVAPTLFFAQFGNGEGLSSDIQLFSLVAEEAFSSDLEVRDDNGDLLPVVLNGSSTDGTAKVDVSAGGLGSLKSNSTGTIEVGSVTAVSSEVTSGVIVFDGPSGLAGVGSSAPIQKAFAAPMEVKGNVNTGIALQNLEDQDLIMDLELTTIDGDLVSTGTLTLPPKGHLARFVDQFQWNDNVDFTDFRGLLKVKVSGRGAATVIQVRGSEFATMPVAVLDGVVAFSGRDDVLPSDRDGHLESNQLYFAQFGDGQGLFSQIILFNLNPTSAANAMIELRTDSGSPLETKLNGEDVDGSLEVEIPAGGVRIFESDGTADSISAGSVTVSSDRPLSGVILFGGPTGVAGVGNSLASTVGFIAPMQVNEDDTINTGVAMMNLEEEEVVIDLELRDNSGSILATSQLTLASLGHRALFVTEIDWDTSLNFNNFRGLMTADSGGKRIASTVIQSRSQQKQFATMPVTERVIREAVEQ